MPISLAMLYQVHIKSRNIGIVIGFFEAFISTFRYLSGEPLEEEGPVRYAGQVRHVVCRFQSHLLCVCLHAGRHRSRGARWGRDGTKHQRKGRNLEIWSSSLFSAILWLFCDTPVVCCGGNPSTLRKTPPNTKALVT